VRRPQLGESLGIGFAMLDVLGYRGLMIGHMPAVEGAALVAR
jgi:hypothetical protein